MAEGAAHAASWILSRRPNFGLLEDQSYQSRCLIGILQHRSTDLHEDVVLAVIGGFGGEIGIADHRLCRGGVHQSRLQIVGVLWQRLRLHRTRGAAQRRNLRNGRVDDLDGVLGAAFGLDIDLAQVAELVAGNIEAQCGGADVIDADLDGLIGIGTNWNTRELSLMLIVTWEPMTVKSSLGHSAGAEGDALCRALLVPDKRLPLPCAAKPPMVPAMSTPVALVTGCRSRWRSVLAVTLDVTDILAFEPNWWMATGRVAAVDVLSGPASRPRVAGMISNVQREVVVGRQRIIRLGSQDDVAIGVQAGRGMGI